MTIRNGTLVSIVALALAATSAAEAANITYTGSDSVAGWNVNYSITTDGKVGALDFFADVVSSSITYVGADVSFPTTVTLSDTNTFYFSGSTSSSPSPVTATATALSFNFSGDGGMNFCYVADSICYAYSAAHTLDVADVVFHLAVRPVKEVDDLAFGYSLQPGTYTSVAATNQVFATAVPEPAAWTMMIGGFGFTGIMLRRRLRTPATV